RRQKIGNRTCCREIDAGATALVMEMAVCDPRYDKPAVEIEHPGIRADMRAHLLGAADGDETVAPDRKGLRDFCAVACSEDPGIHDDGVGRLTERAGSGAHERDDSKRRDVMAHDNPSWDGRGICRADQVVLHHELRRPLNSLARDSTNVM